MYIYIYIYMHMYICTHLYVYVHTSTCVHTLFCRDLFIPTETRKLRCYNWMKQVGMARVLPACPFGCMDLEVCMRLSPNEVPPIPIRKSGVPSFPTKICMMKGPSRVPTQKNLQVLEPLSLKTFKTYRAEHTYITYQS